MNIWRINSTEERTFYLSDMLSLEFIEGITPTQLIVCLNALEKISEDPVGMGYNEVDLICKIALDLCYDVDEEEIKYCGEHFLGAHKVISALKIVGKGDPVSIGIDEVGSFIRRILTEFKDEL